MTKIVGVLRQNRKQDGEGGETQKEKGVDSLPGNSND